MSVSFRDISRQEERKLVRNFKKKMERIRKRLRLTEDEFRKLTGMSIQELSDVAKWR